MRIQLIAAAAILGSGIATAQKPVTAVQTVKQTPVASTFTSTNPNSFSMGGDSCAAPTMIMGQGSFVFDLTTATTGTEGQMETACDLGATTDIGFDVWFEWTADADGRANLMMCATPDDTKVAVYPAGGCPAVDTAIACKDDSGGGMNGCGLQTNMVFPVTNGTSYLIQIGVFFDPMGMAPVIGGSAMEMFDIAITPDPTPYQRDFDGTTTNALGLVNGGEQLILNGYMAEGGSDVITSIDLVYGFSGGSGPTGSTARILIYDDPTNDFDPQDAVLVHNQTVMQANVNTDIFNNYVLDMPVAVNGVFFVGAAIRHSAGEFPCPMDQRVNSSGRSWYAAAAPQLGDISDLSATGPNEAVDIRTVGTFDCAWLIRASNSTIPANFPEGCNGDGGNQMGCTDCPCGNNATPGTIGGCVNSGGTSSRLLPTGFPTATGSNMTPPLRFECSGVAPLNSAQLTSGNAAAPANMGNPCFGLNSGIQSVSLDGLRCAVQGVLRHGVRPSDANGDVGVTGNAWGGTNNFFNYDAFTAGQTKFFQVIHRDNAAAVCGTGQNTTQYVEATFTP